jgi:hypothetical protein
MRLLPLLCLVAGTAAVAGAQSARPPAADSALGVVRRLFDGMRAGDSARVRAVFHPTASLVTTLERNGAADVQVTPIDAFVRAVGTPHAEVWDERIFDPVVQVDGGLATVWVQYTFWRGSTMSHCGVDAVHLARIGSDWRIIALADTRRRTGCNMGS